MSFSSIIRQRMIILIILVPISVLVALAILTVKSNIVNADDRNSIIITPSPRASPTVTNSHQLNNGIDPNLLYALIGGSCTILGAIIGAVATIKTVEMKHQLQLQEEENKAERQKQQNEREKIDADKTIESQIQNYRINLSTDPNIAYLQILDMSQPMAVTSIYVRLRLNNDGPTSPLDRELIESQTSHNTEKLIQINQARLEQRVKRSLDPNEAIYKYKHCVIVGDPGSGKTTLLKYLTIKSVNNDLKELPSIPIYIELKTFVRSDFNDLFEFIADQLAKEYGFSKDTITYLKSELKYGNVLVLLDGLDETFVGQSTNEAEETYRRVFSAIQDFRRIYRQSPIVVTVRKAKYQQGANLTHFIQLEVVDFRPEDIQTFVNNWFDESQEQARDLNNQLKQNPRVQALAANPLLLALITLVYETKRSLPKHRTKLYEDCIDTLITKWETKRNVKLLQGFTSGNLEFLLEEVAWHFHMQRQHYFPKEKLLSVISNALPAIGFPINLDTQILEEITNTNSLLKEQAKNWYGFLHLTFQEYFVSLRIAKDGLSKNELAHSDDPWWEEPILLSAGFPKDASPLLQTLLNKSREMSLKGDIFHTNLILAGRYLSASYAVQTISLQEETISLLFDILIKATYSLTRQQIVDTLIEMGKSEVNNRLIGLLYDEHVNKNVQEIIVDTLGTSINSSISSSLLPLLSDNNITKDIRQRIAITLGQQDNSSEIDKLLLFISEPDIDADICGSIIYSLGMSREEHVINKLLGLLIQRPDDWKLHIHIIDTISKSGTNSPAPILRSLLSKSDTNQDVRIHIIDALATLNDQSGIPEFIRLLLEPDIQLKERLCIVDTLSKLGDTSTLMQLQRIYLEPQATPDIHQCLAITLVKLGDHSPVHDLLQVLTDSKAHLTTRQSIAMTLVKLADISIIQQLLKLFLDFPIDITIQKCIIDTMSTLSDHALIPVLIPLVSNQKIEPDIQAHIIYTLETLDKHLPISELLPLLSNDSVNTRILQLIIDKLGENGEHPQIPELLPLLSNQKINQNVRRSVVNAIGKFASDESTTHALAELLYTSDIKDDIHRALWKVSNQARVKISMIDGPSGKVPNIYKW